MRVLLVDSDLRYPFRGTELYTLHLARSLSDRGHRVAIASAHLSAEALPSLDGVEVFVLPVRQMYTPNGVRQPVGKRVAWHSLDVYNPSVLPWMRRTLTVFGPDIVHTQNFQGLSGAVLSSVRRRPHVHTVHDFTLVDPTPTLLRSDGSVRNRLQRARAARARLLGRLTAGCTLIYPSKRTLDIHRRLGWRSSGSRDVVLPHGWFAGSGRARRTRAKDGPLRVLFLGKLSKAKGVDVLLDAWGPGGIAKAELVIGGAGPLEGQVETTAAGTRSVRFERWVGHEAKQRLLAEASVLAFPSRWPETFGLAAAEAVLAGVPVMTSEVAAPEFVRNDTNGLVIRGDADAWGDAIAALASNPPRLARLRSGARRTASELDWDVHVERLESLYRETIAV